MHSIPNYYYKILSLAKMRSFRATTTTILTTYAYFWPFKFVHQSDPHEKVKTMFIESIHYINTGDYKKADQKLHETCAYVNNLHVNKLISTQDYLSKRARIYSEMANLNLFCGNHENAEKLLKQVIQDSLSYGYQSTDSMIVELSLKIAMIFEKSNRINEARIGYKFCIQTQKHKLKNPSDSLDIINEKALLGMCCNYYAKFLYSTKKFEKAYKYTKCALDIANEIYSTDHTNYLNLLIDLGVILVELNRFDEARESILQAVNSSQLNYEQISNETYDFSVNDFSEIYNISSTYLNSLLQLATLDALCENFESTNQLIKKAYIVLNYLSSLNLPQTKFLKQIDELKQRYNL